jgi:hypothetical protein
MQYMNDVTEDELGEEAEGARKRDRKAPEVTLTATLSQAQRVSDTILQEAFQQGRIMHMLSRNYRKGRNYGLRGSNLGEKL